MGLLSLSLYPIIGPKLGFLLCDTLECWWGGVRGQATDCNTQDTKHSQCSHLHTHLFQNFPLDMFVFVQSTDTNIMYSMVLSKYRLNSWT
jgi:hypothetical protein